MGFALQPEKTKRSRDLSGAFHFQAVLRTVLRTALLWAVLRTSGGLMAVGLPPSPEEGFPPEAITFSSTVAAIATRGTACYPTRQILTVSWANKPWGRPWRQPNRGSPQASELAEQQQAGIASRRSRHHDITMQPRPRSGQHPRRHELLRSRGNAQSLVWLWL